MKNKIVLFLIVLLFIGTYFIFKTDNDKKMDEPTLKEDEVDPLTLKVDAKIKEMTTREKIAQMFIIQYRDSSNYQKLYDIFQEYKLGGFILFNENMDTYENTRDFISKLKSYSDIPLIVAMDQEGGRVQRLKYLKETNVTNIPFMYNLGKTNDEELAYSVGKVMAEELRAIGVNVVFAPDIDIFSNKKNMVIGKRSFGSDAEIVSKMSVALARGLEETGVIPTFKHYPGHGDTATDSHLDLPIIRKNYEELKNLELKPFDSAIKNNAKIIMTAHIALPNITNDNTPASLSKVLITDILKKDMNYQGLVITDALNMSALTKYYSNEDIILKAVDAGVDLLLMPNDFESAINVIEENVSIDRIDESVKKILTFKYQYLSNYELLGKEYLGSKEHKDIVSKIDK